MLGVTILGEVEARQAIKYTPLEKKILRAKTREDFRKILSELSLISPLDNLSRPTIDAAMKIPQSKRLLVFRCVYNSSRSPNDNDFYFKIFADLPEGDIRELFKAASLFIPQMDNQYDRQNLYDSFELVPKGKRLKFANYIKGIMPFNKKNVNAFVREIIRIPEEDLPDVMARVLMIAKDLTDYGIEDLISAISYIPKDRREFIITEANKLSSSKADTLDKAQLIAGLSKLKPDDFSSIVELGKQLFFEDTPGGHRSLILKCIQGIGKDRRHQFVSHVKPFMKAEDSCYLRLAIIDTLANFEESDRITFINYLPSHISNEIKDKMFDNLRYIKEKDLKTILSYVKEHLPEKPADAEKLLTLILSSIQMIKLNK